MKGCEGLVLSSGGIKGLLQLGVLDYLHSNQYLTDIKYVSGCSVGSIIGLLWCIGYTPHEIFDMVCKQNLFQSLRSINPLLLSAQYGLIDNTILRHTVEDMIIGKIGFIPTFEQLYTQFGKYYVCNACKIDNDEQLVYFSKESHPTMSILDACMLSSSIPLLFTKTEYENHFYIDGALLDWFPIRPLRDINKDMNIIGITFDKVVDKHITTLKDYIFSLFVVFEKSQQEYKSTPTQFIFPIRNQTCGIKFDISIDDAIRMFVDGKEQIKRFLNPPVIIEPKHIVEEVIIKQEEIKKEKVD